MNRFSATTRSDRRELIAAAIRARRDRESEFCTFEPDEADVPDVEELGVPWVQCGDGKTTFDCTPTELDRAKDVLDSYPQYRIEEIVRPDESAGAYVVISSPDDGGRRARFVDELFVSVFGLDPDYRLWVAAV